jgi:predicted glycosyltransferase
MNILIQLSHPAHFHLYKNVARNLMDDGHHVFILIKTKDILEDLLKKSDLPYYNILKVAHRKSKFGVLLDMLVRDWRIMCFSLKNQVHLLTGSTPEVAQVGWLLHKNAVNCGEDDMPVVPAWEKVGGPFVDAYLCPDVCFNRKIEKKTVHYPSYH